MSFQILSLGDDSYQALSAGPEQRSTVLDRIFLLRREKNRSGTWRYRLEVVG